MIPGPLNLEASDLLPAIMCVAEIWSPYSLNRTKNSSFQEFRKQTVILSKKKFSYVNRKGKLVPCLSDQNKYSNKHKQKK